MAVDLTSTEQIRDGLLQHFQYNELDEGEILSECVNVCKNYHITPENFYYKWEAVKYSPNSPTISVFTADSIKQIKANIQRDALAEQMKQKPRVQLNGRMSRSKGPVVGLSGWMGAPVKKPFAATPSTPDASAAVAGPSRVKFAGPSNGPEAVEKRAYRYMYEKVSERSEVLDDRIDEFAGLIRDHYSITEFGDPASCTDEDVTIVGRIVSDVESAAPKLNDASIVLESSKMMGSGARMPLRFDPQLKIRGAEGAGGIGLFPGAIAALNGKNGGGGYFLVNEILTLPPLKTRPVDPYGEDSSTSVWVASGSFTSEMDLSYKPLVDLLKKAKTRQPDALVLLGPFIDANHTHIKTGNTDLTPAQLFQTHFLDGLTDFLAASPGSIVVVVPSTKDILSDHPVFPQSELRVDLAYHPRIHFVPNPCCFSLNGVTFGASTVDVLFHLRKEELFKCDTADSSPAGDSMANLCRHLLQQRSFYPLFPVPVELSHDVNLDVSHSRGLRIYPEGPDMYSPDVLVLPSRLKQFSKVVEDSVAINPSFLTKGVYAEVRLPGRRTASLKDEIIVELARLDGMS
ncbi:DNA polymerase alpha subunit B [Neolentinus lepideus HHB14362 ss-1]|uniref:DNA polymerase alpha subunit B n=1 Tax=Neolentinus lepideus HHB14362 ss-1 TaxID=1314782 RepID=A0A165UY50_9AGAM|nr:DNA polymerase alpha subunit B [Neolentinus lepideus HHB14362 ss-1]